MPLLREAWRHYVYHMLPYFSKIIASLGMAMAFMRSSLTLIRLGVLGEEEMERLAQHSNGYCAELVDGLLPSV